LFVVCSLWLQKGSEILTYTLQQLSACLFRGETTAVLTTV
jgi:hypothetical protein